MVYPLLAAGSVLAVGMTLCLVREMRLRLALQSLLKRLFDHWSQPHDATSFKTKSSQATDGDQPHLSARMRRMWRR